MLWLGTPAAVVVHPAKALLLVTTIATVMPTAVCLGTAVMMSPMNVADKVQYYHYTWAYVRYSVPHRKHGRQYVPCSTIQIQLVSNIT